MTIQGQPTPKTRHRTVFSKGKQHEYDTQKRKKEAFAWACRAEMTENIQIIEGAFRLSASFFVSKENQPASQEGLDRLEKPDYDNYLKFVLDALTGSFWTDDSQMTRIGEGGKFHSVNPRTELIIEEL